MKTYTVQIPYTAFVVEAADEAEALTKALDQVADQVMESLIIDERPDTSGNAAGSTK